MKVYISQTMNGKSKKEIFESREKAYGIAKYYFGKNTVFIDPYSENEPKNKKPLWILGNSLQLLSNADAIMFVGDWKKDRSCRIEHACAMEYGITIYEF